MTRHFAAAVIALADYRGGRSSISSCVKSFLRTIPEGDDLPLVEDIHEAIWGTFATAAFDDVIPRGATSRTGYADTCSRFFCLMYNAPAPNVYIKRQVRKRIVATVRPKPVKRWRLGRKLVLELLENKTIDMGYKALLSFAWDTLSRIGEITSDPHLTKAFQPLPISALSMSKKGSEEKFMTIRCWSKTSKVYENITISKEGYHANPAGVGSARYMKRYLKSRGVLAPDDPLWVDAKGKPINTMKFNRMLKKFIPKEFEPHVSGHCVRASAACELYTRKMVGMDHLRELGRWKTMQAMRVYIDKDVLPLIDASSMRQTVSEQECVAVGGAGGDA